MLVHGAWHGAWSWERVIADLGPTGLPVVAIDLPGHGEDDRELTDLHGDAQRVREVLDTLSGPVVLVGHSYGGAVITEAGVHERVRHLVYVSAFAIDETESCVSAAASDPSGAAISHDGRPDLAAGLDIDGEGRTTLAREVAAACFFNDCDAESTAWALDRLGPQLLTSLQQSPAAVAWRSKPSTYAVCAVDMTVHPDLQRLLAQRCTASVEWPTSHSPFLSRPDLVAGLIAEVAAEVRAG